MGSKLTKRQKSQVRVNFDAFKGLDDVCPQQELELRREFAADAFEKGDARNFVDAAPLHNLGLTLVFDNMSLLAEKGMLPEALAQALTGPQVQSHYPWSAAVEEMMLRQCQQQCGIEALRDAGEPFDYSNPDRVLTVYRGVAGTSRQRKVHGVSWTTSLDAACWFALRREFLGLCDPAVYAAETRVSEIFYYDNDAAGKIVVVRPKDFRRLELSVEEMRERSAEHAKVEKAAAAAALKTLLPTLMKRVPSCKPSIKAGK